MLKIYQEGRVTLGDALPRRNPREDGITETQSDLFGRYEAPDLGQHDDEGDLLEVGALSRKIGAGDDQKREIRPEETMWGIEVAVNKVVVASDTHTAGLGGA